MNLATDTAVDGELAKSDDGKTEEEKTNVLGLGDETFVADRIFRHTSTYIVKK